MTDPQELSRRLREQRIINITNHNQVRAYLDADSILHHQAASIIDAQAAEIARCHARLEIDHFFVMGKNDDSDLERVDIPMEERASIPDAVSARDATIALLEADVRAQAARIAEMEKALTESRGHAQHWYGEIETIGVLLGIGAPDAGEVPSAVRANIDLKDTLILDLQAALEPFAAIGELMTDEDGWSYADELSIEADPHYGSFAKLKSGDFRTARKALSNE